MLSGPASSAIGYGLLKPRGRQRSVGRQRHDVEFDEPAFDGAQGRKGTANGRRHGLVGQTLAVVVDVEIGPVGEVPDQFFRIERAFRSFERTHPLLDCLDDLSTVGFIHLNHTFPREPRR